MTTRNIMTLADLESEGQRKEQDTKRIDQLESRGLRNLDDFEIAELYELYDMENLTHQMATLKSHWENRPRGYCMECNRTSSFNCLFH